MDRKRLSQVVKRDVAVTWRATNLQRTVAHVRRPAAVTADGRRVIADLRRDGVALSDVESLTGDPGLFARILSRVDELLAQEQETVDRRRDDRSHGGVSKPFLVELLGDRPMVSRRDPLTEFVLHDGVRGVAEAYYRMQVDLRDLNVWLNLRGDGPATSSQRWHRDLREDHSIVKCFLFLRDVTVDNGATEYALGTHRGRGARLTTSSVYDGIGWRVADEGAFEQVVPVERRRHATGPAGTVAFMDTAGYHRGGQARGADRLLVQALYASGSSIRPRTLQLDPADAHEPLQRVVVRPVPPRPARLPQPASRQTG